MPASRKMTPAETAIYDRVSAEADHTLDQLVAQVRQDISADGEAATLVELAVALQGRPSYELAGCLISALRRLASLPGGVRSDDVPDA